MKKIYVIAIASMISGGAIFAQQTMPQAFADRTRTVVAHESSIEKAVEASMRKKKASAFGQGKSIISVGYGFPNIGKAIFNVYDIYTDFKVTGIGPMHLKYEYGVSDKIGMGLSVNLVTSKVSWMEPGYYNDSISYEHRIKSTAYSILARMNIHFATQAKIDPYWGFGLGYSGRKWTYSTDDPNDLNAVSLKNLIPLGFESTIGCRFYFTDNIGAYLEAGFSKSIVQGGLVAKF